MEEGTRMMSKKNEKRGIKEKGKIGRRGLSKVEW